MTLLQTEYKYIQLNGHYVPFITGTRMKVVELISAIKAYNWTPEQLAEQFPHLSLSQIHSALAYYWDRQSEIDTELEQRLQTAQTLRQQAGESSFAARMKTEGFLR